MKKAEGAARKATDARQQAAGTALLRQGSEGHSAAKPEACGGCRFFHLDAQRAIVQGRGICRRFPAEIEKADASWCGEWRGVEEVRCQRAEVSQGGGGGEG